MLRRRDVRVEGKRSLRGLGCALMLLLLGVSSVRAGVWTTYTSMLRINDLLAGEKEVWAATDGGVLRFDRTTSTYSRYTNLDGLAGNNVLSLSIDGEGNLWFGTDGAGLSKFEAASGSFREPFTMFRTFKINAIAVLEEKIFIGIDRGISLFLSDKEEVKESYRQLGAFSKDVDVLYLKIWDGIIWAATEEGVAWADLSLPNLQDPQSWHSDPAPGAVRGIVQVGSELFLGARRGVFRWNEEGYWTADGFPDSSIQRLSSDGGSVVAATEDGGLYRRSAEGLWVPLGGLAQGARALSISASPDGKLWLGTAEHGLRCLGPAGEEPVPSQEGPRKNQFQDLAITQDGILWVATGERDLIEYANGAYRFDGAHWGIITKQRDGIPSDAVVEIEIDPLGRVWLGTWEKGIGLLDSDGTWKILDDANTALRSVVVGSSFVVANEILSDSAGNMWISNFAIGIAVLDGFPQTREFLYSPASANLPDVNVTAMAIDQEGMKWAGTFDAGFFMLDDGGTPFQSGDERVIFFSTASDDESVRLTSNKITDIAVAPSGHIWLATDNGVNVFEGIYDRDSGTYEISDWRIYTTEDGLKSNAINAILIDPEDTKWIGTERGLSEISSDESALFTYTTANSGLVDNRVKSLAFNERAGELWVGTFGGLSRFRISSGSGGNASGGVGAYPNPFIIGGKIPSVAFPDVPRGATLKIFTPSGELVREISGDEAPVGFAWDGRNDAGFLVGSGIYFYVAVEGGGGTVVGKVAVINTL